MECAIRFIIGDGSELQMALNGAEREDNFCHKSAVMYSICELPEAAPGHHAMPIGQLQLKKVLRLDSAVVLTEGASLG